MLPTLFPSQTIGFCLFSAGLLGALAVYTWQYRRERGAWLQAATMAVKALYVLVPILLALSSTWALKSFWNNLQQLCLLGVPVLALLLYISLARDHVRVPRWVPALFVGLWVFCALAIWTNPWHHAYWRRTWQAGLDIVGEDGPLGYLSLGASYGSMLAGLWVLALWATRARGLRRRHALYFASLLVVGWVGHALGYVLRSPYLPPLMLAWLITGVWSTWAYHRWRIHSVLPLARETALATTANGLLVVDDAEHIVDLNEPARRFLAGLEPREGAPFSTLAAAWPGLVGPARDPHVVQERELSREIDGVRRSFLLRETPIFSGRWPLGRVLVFRDITREKEQQSRLLEQEKALSALRERDRLGRELHDGPGQLWSFVAMQAQAVRALLEQDRPQQAMAALDRLIQVTGDVHLELRESITGLQTGTREVEDLPAFLEAQLAWYRQHAGIDAVFHLEGAWDPDRLPLTTKVQVQRILQEALSNVRKSSGARHLEVRVQVGPDWMEIRVEDDGRGFDPEEARARPGHHGLHIMAGRAAEIGAELTLSSAPGCGTEVCLRIR